MPAKGTSLKTGERLRIVTPKFHRRFAKETNIEIPYALFSSIIAESNEISSNRIIDNISGYKMPENMGYLAVTRYKPKKRAIDFKRTKELGQVVYFTNFHSFGYSNRMVWFSSQITQCKNHQIYKFIPERKVSRKLGEKSLTGKVYNEFRYSDFKTRKLRLDLDKKFK